MKFLDLKTGYAVGGIPQSGQLDTVLVVDVDEEFESVIGHEEDMLPTEFLLKHWNALLRSPPILP